MGSACTINELTSVTESSNGKTLSEARYSLSSGTSISQSVGNGDNRVDKESVEMLEELPFSSLTQEKGKSSEPKPPYIPSSKNSVRGRPSACVFVASLSSSKLDEDLSISVTRQFAKWGSLSTVKVLRDTSNRPYAFVQYTNELDCIRAIREGHNTILHGRKIRCEAAKVNRTIFVSALNNITEAVMSRRLGSFGEIEQLVATNHTGDLFFTKIKAKGSKSWFCKFAYRDDAIGAFASLTEEDTFKVEWAQNIEAEDVRHGRHENSYESGDIVKVKFDKFSVFIGQLIDAITEEELHVHFSFHGTIENIDLIRKPKGTFAFIFYTEEVSAARAVERENHSILRGKAMHVQYREVHYIKQQSQGAKHGPVLATPPINFNKRKGMNSYGHKSTPGRPKERPYQLNPRNKFTGMASNYNRYNTGDLCKRFGKGPTENSNEGIDKENMVIQEEPKTEKLENKDKSISVPCSNQNTPEEFIDPNPPQFSPQVPFFYYIPNSDLPVGGNNFLPPSSARGPPIPHPSYFYQQYYLPYENPEYRALSTGQFGVAPYPMYYHMEDYEKANENNKI
jgi:RNA recognition motif-containing protein